MIDFNAKKLFKKHKIYGSTVVGSKGQIVIPVEARKDLKIKSGDHLIVIGKMGKALGLIKPEELSRIASFIMKNFEFFFDKRSKKFLKAETEKILKTLTRYKK